MVSRAEGRILNMLIDIIHTRGEVDEIELTDLANNMSVAVFKNTYKPILKRKFGETVEYVRKEGKWRYRFELHPDVVNQPQQTIDEHIEKKS